MPMHVQPVLRSNEKARETNGILKALNSVGYTRFTNAEASGKRPQPKAQPVGGFWWLRGSKIAPAT